MTISYQRDVASSTAGGFTRILFKWKGGSLSPAFIRIKRLGGRGYIINID